MQSFYKTKLDLGPVKEFIAQTMKEHGVSRDEAKEQYNRLQADEIWCNDKYQVNIDRNPEHNFGDDIALVHLSIKTLDKAPIHDWREFQEIKNLIVGPECEGIEIYPAESRLLDSANQYHLWVLPWGAKVPCGFYGRGVTSEQPPGGGVQRPLEPRRSHWDEVEGHPVQDWRYEIANDDTRLGYLAWVEAREENPDD